MSNQGMRTLPAQHWDRIPAALKRLPQWCWSSLDPKADGNVDKKPLCSRGGTASTTNPSSWGTFEEACNAAGLTGGVGFVLTKEDPFYCIDLDVKASISDTDRANHVRIIEAFAKSGAYIESSVRGGGLHIWARRTHIIPVRKVGAVEVYDNQHYILCTGNPHERSGGDSLPELTAAGEWLCEQLHPFRNLVDTVLTVNTADDLVLSDDEVIERAQRANNGGKFQALYDGDWQGLGYPSQSEADLALMNILCFSAAQGTKHTPLNREQIVRLFRSSGLGRRNKGARHDYVGNMLGKWLAEESRAIESDRKLNDECDARDARLAAEEVAKMTKVAVEQAARNVQAPVVHTMREVPTEASEVWPGQEKHDRRLAAHAVQPKAPTGVVSEFTHPPGIVGELSRWIEASAFMPMRETAIVSALSFAAGIGGRTYNTQTGLGLALNLVLVAPTATGKEGLGDAHDALFAAVHKSYGSVYKFQGGHFASGQAFARVIANQPCFVSVVDEFGIFIQRHTSDKASDAQRAFIGNLLQISTKGGAGKRWQGTSFSDTKKDVPMVLAPNPTIVGSTTASTLFDKLSETQVRNGLFPRLVVFEYKGAGAAKRKGAPIDIPENVLSALVQLTRAAITSEQNNTHVRVPLSSEAEALYEAFDDETRSYTPDSLRWDLFTRAPANALKIATLLAVLKNPTGNPSLPACVVSEEEMAWAVQTVRKCDNDVAKRFEDGDAGGEGESKITRLEAIIRSVQVGKLKTRVNAAAREKGIITEDCLWQNAKKKFEGRSKDFTTAIEGLVRRGWLREVSDPTVRASLAISGKAYFMRSE